MSKYTPGPWWVGEKKSGYVAQIQIQPAIAISWGAIDEEEADANARLIAAAPDLLEALELLIDDLALRAKLRGDDCLDVSDGRLYKAQKAIAKAKGENE
jgi:hypothetical protein